MLIPSIDLQFGRIVQLVQGERLALEFADIDGWIDRFRPCPKVQLIDLDAAKGEGRNDALVRRICAELPCRVGGGVRSLERAQEVLSMGATHVILSSALFANGGIDLDFAARLAATVGPQRLIAAVDSRGGTVVIHGWRTALDITPVEAVRRLEPFFDEFLYTHVDREGLMAGTDMEAIAAVKAATTKRLTAAGGITTLEEVARLDAAGIDAVVGMALYTGRIGIEARPNGFRHEEQQDQ
jgi:phosphoribosylformimino-5-aminoimidazole carboxamide ribonucleotide (ProFAR) isomerase